MFYGFLGRESLPDAIVWLFLGGGVQTPSLICGFF
jgi:hypothetical protein